MDRKYFLIINGHAATLLAQLLANEADAQEEIGRVCNCKDRQAGARNIRLFRSEVLAGLRNQGFVPQPVDL